jgi:hypothetical protein
MSLRPWIPRLRICIFGNPDRGAELPVAANIPDQAETAEKPS